TDWSSGLPQARPMPARNFKPPSGGHVIQANKKPAHRACERSEYATGRPVGGQNSRPDAKRPCVAKSKPPRGGAKLIPALAELDERLFERLASVPLAGLLVMLPKHDLDRELSLDLVGRAQIELHRLVLGQQLEHEVDRFADRVFLLAVVVLAHAREVVGEDLVVER